MPALGCFTACTTGGASDKRLRTIWGAHPARIGQADDSGNRCFAAYPPRGQTGNGVGGGVGVAECEAIAGEPMQGVVN